MANIILTNPCIKLTIKMNMGIYSITMIFLMIFSQVSINEVMSNVKGKDSGILSPGDRNEFIELYNYSDSFVDIGSWRISDGNADDRIVMLIDSEGLFNSITHTTRMFPHSYAVIIDPEYTIYSEEYYMPYIFPDSCIIMTVGNTTLGENGLSAYDVLMLKDLSGCVISTFGTPEIEDDFPFDPGDGVTFERINPLADDSKSNWKQCSKYPFHSAGMRNSVFCSYSMLDTAYMRHDTLILSFSYVSPVSDSVIIQGENMQYSIRAGDTSLYYPDNDIVNIISYNDTLSVLKESGYGRILLNEFFVSGSDREWVEIKNNFGICYKGPMSIISNGDTLLSMHVSMGPDTYIVFCEDTLLLWHDFDYIEDSKCLYYSKLSLPDRIDTFILQAGGVRMDSIIRGYEECGPRSIERINGSNDWDISVSQYGATPLMSNSLFMSFCNKGECTLSSSIWNENTPVITLNISSKETAGYADIHIYDELGHLCQYAGRYSISTEASIPIRWTHWKLNKGMYIMTVHISGKNNDYYKLLFYIR